MSFHRGRRWRFLVIACLLGLEVSGARRYVSLGPSGELRAWFGPTEGFLEASGPLSDLGESDRAQASEIEKAHGRSGLPLPPLAAGPDVSRVERSDLAAASPRPPLPKDRSPVVPFHLASKK